MQSASPVQLAAILTILLSCSCRPCGSVQLRRSRSGHLSHCVWGTGKGGGILLHSAYMRVKAEAGRGRKDV
jgi:hypothetical protein